jgi:hypothetical protein
MTPFTYLLATDPDDQFTGALATNATENENLVLNAALAGVNGAAQGLIRSITIVSDQNLAWELQWYTADTFQNADPEVDSFLSYWAFAAADGVQVAATGLYRYYVDGLAIPYKDADASGEMHISLINRSVTSKNAGATGEIKVTLGVEPMGN